MPSSRVRSPRSRSWGLGHCPILCLSRAPPPAPRSPRCAWQVVSSGCPLPSPAGTPFRAVCAVRGLPPFALLVFLACPLHVCALALSRSPCPSSPPGSVWRAHLGPFRCRAPVGPFHAVHAPPRFLPRSRALSGLFFGVGGGPVFFSPCLAWGRVPPGGPACASLAVRRRGGGGGAACVPSPPAAWPGGPRGGGSPYLGLSLCLSWAGTKAGVIGVAQFMEGVASILLRFVFAC